MSTRTIAVFVGCSGFLACNVFVAPFKMAEVARQLAPASLGCPSDHVSPMHHGGSRLATEPSFHGCGRYVTYHCMSLLSDVDETQCVPIAVGDDRH
jgi:hypothetical protein